MKNLQELCQLLPCLGKSSGKATHFVTVNALLYSRAKMRDKLLMRPHCVLLKIETGRRNKK